MTTERSEAGDKDPLIARIETLVAHFAEIGETQMKDLPIYNHKLDVEAIGFRPFCARYVGVLITPWFVNAIALPRVFEAEKIDSGESQETVELPCGPQIFLRSFGESIGTYYSKSLLSALFHLHSQDDARAEAGTYLTELLTPARPTQVAAAQGADVSRRDFFRGRVK